MATKKVGKIRYSEPKSYFPEDIEREVWGNTSKSEKKPATKKSTTTKKSTGSGTGKKKK